MALLLQDRELGVLADGEALRDASCGLGEGAGEGRVGVGHHDRVTCVAADADRRVQGDRAQAGEVVALSEAAAACACCGDVASWILPVEILLLDGGLCLSLFVLLFF